ncbi:MAG: hypothetical protein HQL52_01465 [Magnetococcales bacterium]|nr:hypothetical protein [Magnetococcales bacterium]
MFDAQHPLWFKRLILFSLFAIVLLGGVRMLPQFALIPLLDPPFTHLEQENGVVEIDLSPIELSRFSRQDQRPPVGSVWSGWTPLKSVQSFSELQTLAAENSGVSGASPRGYFQDGNQLWIVGGQGASLHYVTLFPFAHTLGVTHKSILIRSVLWQTLAAGVIYVLVAGLLLFTAWVVVRRFSGFYGPRYRRLLILAMALCLGLELLPNWHTFIIGDDSPGYLSPPFQTSRPPVFPALAMAVSGSDALRGDADGMVHEKFYVAAPDGRDQGLLRVVQGQKVILAFAWLLLAALLMRRYSPPLVALLFLGMTFLAPGILDTGRHTLIVPDGLFWLVFLGGSGGLWWWLKRGRTLFGERGSPVSLSDETPNLLQSRPRATLLTPLLPLLALLPLLGIALLITVLAFTLGQTGLVMTEINFLLSETLAQSVLALLAGVGVLFFGGGQARWLIAAGALCGILYMIRHAGIFGVVFFGWMALFGLWRDWRRYVGPMALAMACFVAVASMQSFHRYQEQEIVEVAPVFSLVLATLALQFADESDLAHQPDPLHRRYLREALALKKTEDAKRVLEFEAYRQAGAQNLPSLKIMALNTNMYRVLKPLANGFSEVSGLSREVFYQTLGHNVLPRHLWDWTQHAVGSFWNGNETVSRLSRYVPGWLLMGVVVGLGVWLGGAVGWLAISLLTTHIASIGIVALFDVPVGRYIYLAEPLLAVAMFILILSGIERLFGATPADASA